MDSKKSKKLGIFLIIAPFALLIIVMFIFGIIQSAAGDDPAVAVRVVRIIFGLLGIISVIGIFTAVPTGIVFLVKSAKNNEIKQ